MEPFRPVVDRTVVEVVHAEGADAEMTQELRATLIQAIMSRVFVEDRVRTVMDALAATSTSLVDAMSGSQTPLALPQEFAHAAA